MLTQTKIMAEIIDEWAPLCRINMVLTQDNILMNMHLVSEPSRAAILTALLDGRFHTASELAHMAGIKPQTASFHLAKMTEAQVVIVEKQGRHRYFGIQDPKVAQVMESLLSIAPPVPIKSFTGVNDAITLQVL